MFNENDHRVTTPMEPDTDPREGSSFGCDTTVVKFEIKDEPLDHDDEDNFNTMALLELATCVQNTHEQIDFNSTDAMVYQKTGNVVCLHCLTELKPTALQHHMVTVHNYRRILYKCHICNSTFHERNLLQIHKKECRVPQKPGKRKSFKQIMRQLEKGTGIGQDYDGVCPICMLELPKFCLKDHLIEAHKEPELSLTCEICSRNFKSKLTLREHIKLVHQSVEDSEECELCGQKFSSLKYLSNHKRNVHPSGDKVHKCSVCLKQFKSRLCLHQHVKHVHPPRSARAECPHCAGKVFKSRVNLRQHLKVAHGARRAARGDYKQKPAAPPEQ